MYKQLFNSIKKIIPKISDTEIIALKSGGVSIDREIFKGRINYKALLDSKNTTKISENEKKIIQYTNELLKLVGQSDVYPNKNIKNIMSYLS